jgi:uncharacterized membrane protein YfcA
VVILVIVGGYVFYDAWRVQKSGEGEKVSSLALRLQKINLPPMMYFKTANLRISMWFTIPIGFATGLLAATIAVGGFIGVPGMIYGLGATGLVASATELVIAFVMGFFGTVKWAMHGMVDIRLTLIILAGSLLGVQLGAIGTTYVKEHMIKVVMGTIMIIVAVSRGLAVPQYLKELGLISLGPTTLSILSKVSFAVMCLALAIGSVIILGAMWKAKRSEARVRSADYTLAEETYR